MKKYPSWRYHAEKEPVIIKDEEAEKALGPGWEHSPVALEKKTSRKDEELPKEVEPKEVVPKKSRKGGVA